MKHPYLRNTSPLRELFHKHILPAWHRFTATSAPAGSSRRELRAWPPPPLKSGCQWRMLPADFPNWGTCYKYFQQWSQRPDPEQESILEQVLKKIGWRGPEKQWSERADQLLHRGLPERQEHGQRRAEGL